MRQIVHFLIRVGRFLTNRLEAFKEWLVWNILWPIGAISLGLAVVCTFVLIATLITGGFILIPMIIAGGEGVDHTADLFLTALGIEFAAATVFWCVMVALSDYFDRRNGLQ
jgi:hypothetical protein